SRAGRALAGLMGRDYVIPDDIKALAEPALAHRLIIKTSASIHDVQSANVVRELLDSTPIDGIRPTGGPDRPKAGAAAGRAPSPAPGQGAERRPRGRERTGMMRRIQLLIIAAILLIAAFSTGLEFLFYLVYLAIIVIGGSYVVTRLGLSDLEAAYAASHL